MVWAFLAHSRQWGQPRMRKSLPSLLKFARLPQSGQAGRLRSASTSLFQRSRKTGAAFFSAVAQMSSKPQC